MNSAELERYELAIEKIKSELSEDLKNLSAQWRDFFKAQMSFLCVIDEAFRVISEGKATSEDLRKMNKKLYSDILASEYDKSYCNPDFAANIFGKELGQLVSALAFEMRSSIPFAYENEGSGILIRIELLLEVYRAINDLTEENADVVGDKVYNILKDIIYWYVSDYYEIDYSNKVKEMVDPSYDFATKIIETSDLSKTDYLYRYGEYITDNEIKLSEYIASLPEEKVEKIADTYTEGYRIGFVNTGKDLSKKETVNIRYPLGMERIVKKAIDNFEKMGLKPVIYRAVGSLFRCNNIFKVGYFGANPNKQYDYDHAKDNALYLDGAMVTRKLECLKNSFDEYKEMANKHAGPAVIESFGESPFVPATKESVTKLSKEQEKLSVKYTSKAGSITNEYIKGEERSFTIIAFPVPEIGENFEKIFDATLEINTLDYKEYHDIQQAIIDELDTADYVHVVGKDGNETDLTVNLIKLNNPDKETKFENCVADVNIPVGEVFTSPVLNKTSGVLAVKKVFLNGLEFRGLKLQIKDGMISEYNCTNYEDENANKAFFKENVLFNFETLPMGEFAIGTNTMAYMYGKKYSIEGVLPILIAEKTGPHFAFGDTCYSHAEDIKVYNPCGKEIIARDNEISILRKEDVMKAYFNCHTDITLPYDEIGLIEGIREDGSRFDIIRDGRFALDEAKALNKYL